MLRHHISFNRLISGVDIQSTITATGEKCFPPVQLIDRLSAVRLISISRLRRNLVGVTFNLTMFSAMYNPGSAV
jgi:hypothetical protein